MDASKKKHVRIKIFVGFELKQLSAFLNHNNQWKQAEVSQTTPLQKVRYLEKEYIGLFLPSEQVPMNTLRETAEKTRREMQRFCPENDLSQFSIQIFPQVFVA